MLYVFRKPSKMDAESSYSFLYENNEENGESDSSYHSGIDEETECLLYSQIYYDTSESLGDTTATDLEFKSAAAADVMGSNILTKPHVLESEILTTKSEKSQVDKMKTKQIKEKLNLRKKLSKKMEKLLQQTDENVVKLHGEHLKDKKKVNKKKVKEYVTVSHDTNVCESRSEVYSKSSLLKRKNMKEVDVTETEVKRKRLVNGSSCFDTDSELSEDANLGAEAVSALCPDDIQLNVHVSAVSAALMQSKSLQEILANLARK